MEICCSRKDDHGYPFRIGVLIYATLKMEWVFTEDYRYWVAQEIDLNSSNNPVLQPNN